MKGGGFQFAVFFFALPSRRLTYVKLVQGPWIKSFFYRHKVKKHHLFPLPLHFFKNNLGGNSIFVVILERLCPFLI